MSIVFTIVVIIAIIFIGRFLIYFGKVNNFFSGIANEYVSLQMRNYDRQLSNRMIILKRLTGNSSFSISTEAAVIIDLFDIVDTMQFLLFFNGSLQSKLDTIPKLAPDDVARNDRSLILRSGLNRTQRSFIVNGPHLRNNTIDLIDEFKVLAPLLVRDCQLFHRISNGREQAVKPKTDLRFDGRKVYIEKYQYAHGDRIGLYLKEIDGNILVTTLTINLPFEQLGQDEVFIKNYSENEGILDWLCSNQIVRDTGRRVKSGYVEVPVVRVL